MLNAAQILGPDGRIAQRLPRYEMREEQLQMAESITAALEAKKHLIVEAGTGVGKSFAYLVPAILHVTADQQKRAEDEEPRRRIVISTHTISLQEQLLTKDIPLLQSVIPYEFTAVLAKGRGNYVSLRRMKNAAARARNLFIQQEELEDLRNLVAWSKTTGDGSLSDLQTKPARSVWDEVASDSGNCLGRNCPEYTNCFYFKARRRIYNAQILIVNHALFFSDLALRKQSFSLLPDYDAVIFDEAHTLEQVAGDHLGLGITSGQVQYSLHRLYNDRTNKGLLAQKQFGKEQELVLETLRRMEEYFEDVYAWHALPRNKTGRMHAPPKFEDLLSPSLVRLARAVKQAGEKIEKDDEKQDFIAAHDRLLGLASELTQWHEQQLPESVYWVESTPTRYQRPKFSLCSSPLHVGSLLRETLFDQVKTVVLTSATLATGKETSFDFYQKRIGLVNTNKKRLGSPFEYRKQAQLILVSGLPDPGQDKEGFERKSLLAMQKYIERTDGHAFVLFTSYESLKRAAEGLAPWLMQRELALYSQAEGIPRTQLIENFKKNPRGVLLGTDSFWQGVDVPGEALTNVIIPKLPFSVPDHPLLEARLETIRSTGGNPFRDYQLPEAIIKLRQGFGRLIRSKDDHGIVVLLDPRIKTKTYGQTFLQALPDCERVVEPF